MSPGQGWSPAASVKGREALVPGSEDRSAAFDVDDDRTLAELDRIALDLLTHTMDSAADQVDALVEMALRELVAALGIERSAVLRFSSRADETRIANVWIEGDAPPAPAILRPDQFPWTLGELRRGNAVSFASLNDLPPEAAVDLGSFRGMGLRAHASVPVLLSGEIAACLTCGSYSHERNWSDATMRRLRQMAAVIGTALQPKIHAEDLGRVVGFERLAASVLASILIAGPAGEDAAIISGLHGIAGFLGVDRATLWQWDEADERYNISHRWLSDATGDPPVSIAEREVPWLSSRLRAGHAVAFASPNELPTEASADLAAFHRFGLTAVLAVPMAPSAGATGAFVLSNTRRERGWPQNVIDGSQLFAEVFANLLARRSARAKLEAAERRAERDRDALGYMARVDVLGKLSASIAHQLNQPLSAILANAEAARMMLDREPVDLVELQAICADIIAEDHRAADVIRRLGALYRRGEVAAAPLDLNLLVAETLELLRTELMTREITVSADLDKDLGLIKADRVQLQQVLLNLIVNAADAMKTAAPPRRLLSIRTERHAGEAKLTVRDHGSGIPPADLETIFDAFWTTKASGLGIGLAISQSIVVAHGGRLTAGNADGGGAVFDVLLPQRDV
jgi:signal transduction histidine kinase